MSAYVQQGDVLYASSSLTCFLSTVVIVTTLGFRTMRDKFFMHIVMMISFSDLMANLATFFPVTGDRCTLHGMWMYFFFGASYNWTVILAYLLFKLATEKKVVLRKRTTHMIAWSLAAIRGCLPYATTVYVQDVYWCYIKPRPGFSVDWSIFWNVIVFPVWIGGSFLLILYWRYQLHVGLARKTIDQTLTVQVALETLGLYPILLIVCWMPRLVNDVAYISGYDVINASKWTQTIIQVIFTLHGSLVAVVFFWKSKEAQRKWADVYRDVYIGYCCIPTRQSTISRSKSSAEMSLNQSSLLSFLSRKSSHFLAPRPRKDQVFTNSILHIEEFYSDSSSVSSSNPVHAIGSVEPSPTPSPTTSTRVPSEAAAVIAEQKRVFDKLQDELKLSSIDSIVNNATSDPGSRWSSDYREP